ncbi:MAG: ABC transporter ATP-binding protein/permease [Erysipelotrichales bacterium]|nr:ABC transporter ATP-binding protein/permease [Erysipelotrichales bacterium]
MLFGKHINKYYIKYLFPFLFGILFLLVIGYVQLLIPTEFARMVDGLSEGTMLSETMSEIVIRIFLFGIIVVIGRVFWRVLLIGTARRIEFDLKNKLFDHAQKLSAEYHNRQKVGALMSLNTADVDSIRNSLGFGVVMFVDATFLTILVLVRMFQLNVLLTFMALLPMLIIAIGGLWWSVSLTKSHKRRQEAQEKLSDFTQENFSGIAVIKAYVKERRELKEFTKYNKNVYDTSMDFIKKIAFLETLIETLIGLSIIFIFALGGYFTIEGIISPGELVAFYLLFIILIWPMIALAQVLNNLSQGRASLKRISEFLDAPITIKDDGYKPETALTGAITFRNLTFIYPETERVVLDNVTFSIQAGEMVGIVGRTGCGKSTIAEVLLRTYNFQEDAVFVDDHDIMKISVKSLRDSIGYVPQSNFLFSDTIFNNIAFGTHKEVTQAEIEHFAALSDIDRNIKEFPEKYQTVVGERGTTLSGGQKQRVSIARALIKDPSILIFDDSVSAVDTITEATILTNLRKIRDNKTTIIIGHRLSTMQNMDKIVLIDEGKVVAVGTHLELLETSALYQEMLEAQKLQD